MGEDPQKLSRWMGKRTDPPGNNIQETAADSWQKLKTNITQAIATVFPLQKRDQKHEPPDWTKTGKTMEQTRRMGKLHQHLEQRTKLQRKIEHTDRQSQNIEKHLTL